MGGVQRLRDNRDRLERAVEEAREAGRLRWPLAALAIIILSILAWAGLLAILGVIF